MLKLSGDLKTPYFDINALDTQILYSLKAIHTLYTYIVIYPHNNNIC